MQQCIFNLNCLILIYFLVIIFNIYNTMIEFLTEFQIKQICIKENLLEFE